MAQETPSANELDDFITQELLADKKPTYKHKGYGKIVAFMITIFYLMIFPIILKHIFKFFQEKFTLKQIQMGMGVGLHTGVYSLAHIIMYFIYTQKIPFFERYRIITSPWPWESNPEKWKKLLKETLQTTFLAHFVIIPYLVWRDAQGEIMLNFKISDAPNLLEISWQLIFCSIIEDTWFYWGHRILHHKWLYPYIHKKHHSYTMTVSIAAEHLHIIEYFFVSLLSTSVPVSMLGRRMHVITYVLYVIFRIMESINAHCGYDFSWSPYGLLPGCQPSSWHNFHHSHQKGNFSGGFWDYICGTHKPYLEYMAKIQSKESSKKKDK